MSVIVIIQQCMNFFSGFCSVSTVNQINERKVKGGKDDIIPVRIVKQINVKLIKSALCFLSVSDHDFSGNCINKPNRTVAY